MTVKQPYWYLARELFGNRYDRLLYHRFLPACIRLIKQHFHLTLGWFTFEMDW